MAGNTPTQRYVGMAAYGGTSFAAPMQPFPEHNSLEIDKLNPVG